MRSTPSETSFTVPLKDGVSGQLGGAKTLFVEATATLGTTNVPSGVDADQIMTTDSLITKIGSQPSLNASVLYDGGVGSGPAAPTKDSGLPGSPPPAFRRSLLTSGSRPGARISTPCWFPPEPPRPDHRSPNTTATRDFWSKCR